MYASITVHHQVSVSNLVSFMCAAIGTSQNEAVRAKGAAGPVLSALVTASDIARRMKGTCTDAQKGKGPVKPTIGKYEKSQTADVSKRGSMPIPTDEEIAAMQAEHAIARKAELRAVEMQAQLGENGMQALEEGVNQVMSTDVQRILKVSVLNLLVVVDRWCCYWQSLHVAVCVCVYCLLLTLLALSARGCYRHWTAA